MHQNINTCTYITTVYVNTQPHTCTNNTTMQPIHTPHDCMHYLRCLHVWKAYPAGTSLIPHHRGVTYTHNQCILTPANHCLSHQPTPPPTKHNTHQHPPVNVRPGPTHPALICCGLYWLCTQGALSKAGSCIIDNTMQHAPIMYISKGTLH
jgi:hypothetical protein